MIIIQQIRATWTKKSRGAPGAIQRNTVPTSLLISPEDCEFLFEQYNFEEEDDFIQRQMFRLVKSQIPPRVHNLVVEHQNNELGIKFGQYYGDGEPIRFPRIAPDNTTNRTDLLLQYPQKRYLLHLGVGKYGRLIVNGRHAEEFYHWYSQDIYNIAVIEQPTSDMFISREPDRIKDLRVRLF